MQDLLERKVAPNTSIKPRIAANFSKLGLIEALRNLTKLYEVALIFKQAKISISMSTSPVSWKVGLFSCFLPFFINTASMSAPRRPATHQSTVEAFMVVDFHSRKILSSYEAGTRRQVASLTKIVTAMVVLDWAELTQADLSNLAVVPASAGLIGGPNRMSLRPGESISLRDALYCALIGSDNWAAETLADHVGRNLLARGNTGGTTSPVSEFVEQMNALAERHGATGSLFTNPHGMDHLEKVPYSCAADIARLAIYALGKSSFTFYCSQKERKVSIIGASGQRQFMIKNTNKLLGQDGIDGVKTGLTRRAGPCLVISADKEPVVEKLLDGRTKVTPRRLVVVVLGASDRFSAARSLLMRGWEKFDAWNAGGRQVFNSQEFLSGPKD